MKTVNDLTEEEKKRYDEIQEKLKVLDKKIDSYEFKNHIEVQKEVLGEYLELSKEEDKLIPHSRKRKFKDKTIKEVYDFSISALELKEKSRYKYERLKNSFTKLFSDKMKKAKK